MAKFRSWNEEYRGFFYFEDGKYYVYTKEECNKNITKFDLQDIHVVNFWQNSEQSTIIADTECFVGDDLIFSFSYLEYGQPDNQIEKQVKGILQLDDKGFYLDTEQYKYYLCNLGTIFDCLICSNVHEEED